MNAFGKLTDINIDLSKLQLEAEQVDKHLTEVLSHIQHLEQLGQQEQNEDEETFILDPNDNGKLSPDEKELLEDLFMEAAFDRSKAYELKRELDRLEVFREYEDRFLDLFKERDE